MRVARRKSPLGLILAIGIALTGLSACATGTQRGFAAYNAGRYEEAYAQWLPMANAGDAAAQYNMGLLWQQGLSIHTPRNADRAGEYFFLSARQGFVQAMAPLAEYQLSKNQPDAALSWLMLAARWNDQTAVVMLNRMGAPIPQPDLAIAQQQAQANAQASLFARHGLCGCTRVRRPGPVAGHDLSRSADARLERQSGIPLRMSVGPPKDRVAAPTEDARERIIFGLEVGSNDPAASEAMRANAERLLRIQRILAGARGGEC